MKYEIKLTVEGKNFLQRSLENGSFKKNITEFVLSAAEGEKLVNLSYGEVTKRKRGEHLFADCGGVPRCVTCGCDEDDAFVGAAECTYGEKTTEQQRRDEKHGLYGGKLDVAN
jgi:hypothetical protein